MNIVRQETLERALAVMKRCRRVINAGVTVGACNRRMGELVRAADLPEQR